jgi:branched-chain amino acid transport system substrate-binding protein
MDTWNRREFLKKTGLAAGALGLAGFAPGLLEACGAPGSDTGTTALGSGLPSQIKVGYITTVTGLAAGEGALAIKAINMAVEEINAKGGIGGKAKIQLFTEDSQSNDPGAVNAFRKAIDQDAVDVLIGPVKSTQVLAMMDQIVQAAIPTIVGGTNVKLTQKGVKWLFRMRPNDGIAAPAMVKYITEDLKVTKIAILHDSDAFGSGGADLVTAAAADKGASIVRREKYTGGDKDFTAQLTNIKNAKPDVLVIYATNSQDDGLILPQIRQQGLTLPIVGSPSTAVTLVYDLAKSAQDGIFAAVDYLPEASAVAKSYHDSYVKKYNAQPDDLSAWVYDSLYVFKKAIETANTLDKSKVRDAVAGIHGFDRVVGKVDFDSKGDGLHSSTIVQMQGGKKQLKKVVTVTS